MLDQFLMVSTAAICGAGIGAGCVWLLTKSDVESLQLLISDLVAENRKFHTAEHKRQQQRLAASQRAAELRRLSAEQEAKEAPARRQRTIEALAKTPLRSRAQVVASVKAKRTKQKKSAGGVAPSKAG